LVNTYLLLGMTYAFAAAVQPGPFLAYLVSQALAHGWRRTLPAALAPLLSDGPVILLTLLVLTRLPVWLAPGLRLAGGLFLLYLAYGTWRTWRTYDPAQLTKTSAGQKSVLNAAMVNILNPGPYLSWSLIMGPLLLKAWSETPASGLALLAGFYGVMVLSLAGIIILFATARQLGPRVNRLLVGVSALALLAFGCYQLWAGLTAILPGTG
jgi:threonine/homoserine/homoserine lactone efflux protein